MTRDRRLYAAVAACAVLVYLGALWNQFAMDDVYIIVINPRVHSLTGMWRAFVAPYWPAELGGKMYRPLVIASFALDWMIGSPAWFHAVNVLWHATASVLVAALARRWAGETAALLAGVIFAFHPVHVEAVANVVGRAELMATVFGLLSVYAALVRCSIAWSALAFALALVSKENAVIVPGIILWAWYLRFDRPARRQMARFAMSWAVVGLAYGVVRWVVVHPFSRYAAIDSVLLGLGPIPVRLTAIAALADVVRLLVFPLALRADYSVRERTAVLTPFDWRFVLGLACLAAWLVLMRLAWRRGRRMEVWGLGIAAIAFLPVANLLFPTGVLIAERTLYLPSAGVALAAGAALSRLSSTRLYAATAAIALVAGIRTGLRIPVWRDDRSVTLSMLVDSPNSYRGPARMGDLYAAQRDPARALAAYQIASRIFGRDPRIFVAAADAAYTAGRSQLADSLLADAERLCAGCTALHRGEASVARARGDTLTARWLEARGQELDRR